MTLGIATSIVTIRRNLIKIDPHVWTDRQTDGILQTTLWFQVHPFKCPPTAGDYRGFSLEQLTGGSHCVGARIPHTPPPHILITLQILIPVDII